MDIKIKESDRQCITINTINTIITINTINTIITINC